jgi:hypothetical protein
MSCDEAAFFLFLFDNFQNHTLEAKIIVEDPMRAEYTSGML